MNLFGQCSPSIPCEGQRSATLYWSPHSVDYSLQNKGHLLSLLLYDPRNHWGRGRGSSLDNTPVWLDFSSLFRRTWEHPRLSLSISEVTLKDDRLLANGGLKINQPTVVLMSVSRPSSDIWGCSTLHAFYLLMVPQVDINHSNLQSLERGRSFHNYSEKFDILEKVENAV